MDEPLVRASIGPALAVAAVMTPIDLDRLAGIHGGAWPNVERVNTQDSGTYVVYDNRAVTMFPAPDLGNPVTVLPANYFKKAR